MFLQVQYPFFDGRHLQPNAILLPYPNWGRLSVSGQYVRKLGKIVSRRRSGVQGVAAEAHFCQLRNSLKTTEDWLAPYPVTSPDLAVADPVTADRPYANNPKFVVRRLFFDGLYSGKLDLGFQIPDHLALEFTVVDRGEGAGGPVVGPSFGTRTFEGFQACFRHLLGRTLRIGQGRAEVGALARIFPQVYAAATSREPAGRDLVRVDNPILYLEFVTKKGDRWGAVDGWTHSALSFAEVYQRSLGFKGRELPLFVARVDDDQVENRGRHLRIATMRFCSEIANAQRLLASLAAREVAIGDNAAAKPAIHAHLKRTLKFLRGAEGQPHIVNAASIVRASGNAEFLESALDQLAGLDDYWEAEKRRELRRIIMGDGDYVEGDKVGGDKVGGDKFGGDKVGRDKIGGDQVTAETGGVAMARGANEGGSVSASYKLDELALDLDRIAAEMRARSTDSVDQVDATIVEEAAKQASEGNESNVVKLLKRVGSDLFKVATDVGAKVALAFLSVKLGLG